MHRRCVLVGVLLASLALAAPAQARMATGFEHGVVSTAGSGIFINLGGNGYEAITTTTRRSGQYAMQIGPAPGGAAYATVGLPPVRRVVYRVALNFSALPSSGSPCVLAVATTSSGVFASRVTLTSTGVLRMNTGAGTTISGPTITPGQWYVVDAMSDTSTSTWRTTWRVNGVAYTDATYATTARDQTGLFLGHTGAFSQANYYDDVALSYDPTEYPLSDGRVFAMRPDGAGTHNTPGNYRNNGGGAIDGTTPGRLAEAPLGSTTSYAYQSTAGGASFLEFTFSDPPVGGTATAVGAYLAQHASGTTATTASTRVIYAGGAESDLYTGNMSTGTTMTFHANPVPPPPGGWTPEQLDGLKARAGFASSIGSQPRWDGILYEAEFPFVPSGLFTSNTNAQTGTKNATDIGTTPRFSWQNTTKSSQNRQRVQVVNDTLDNVVGLWRVNGSGADASPTANNLSLAASPGNPTYVTGQTNFNNALSFDGTDDRATVPYNSAYAMSDNFTVDLWFRTSSIANASMPTLITRDNGTATNRNYSISFDRTNNWLRADVSAGGSVRTVAATATPYVDGQWHHVALVADNGVLRMYVDGSPAGTATTPGPVDMPATTTYIGSNSGTSGFFQGQVDEVRISSVPRSAAEILGYYRTARPHVTTMWDSDTTDAGISLTSCAIDARCADIVYGSTGTALAITGAAARYYARVKYRLNTGAWSDWSDWDWFATPPNVAPNAPTSPAQYRNDGTTSIAGGAWTPDGATNNVVLKFWVSDADAAQTLTPWVEVRSGINAFGATCGTSVAGVTYSGAAVSAASGGIGVLATVNITGLTSGQTYRWRACAVDQNGAVSSWTARGGSPDFGVDADRPPVPGTVNDGTGSDIQYSASSTQLSANWTNVTDTGGSGLNRYEYCISTSTNCSSGNVVGWTTNSTSASFTRSVSLTNGSTYYVCVRTFDNAGNQSTTIACSNGQTVDTTAPTATAAVRDGTSTTTDATWTTSTTALSATWDAASDSGSGLAGYEYCMSTTTTASGCSGTVVASWTSRTLTSVTRSSLTLADGATYFTCVRSVDNAGNLSAVTCSNGITVDATAPPVPSPVSDGSGTDVQWFNTSASITANWADVVDGVSGLRRYQYCMSTATDAAGCTGTVVASWTNRTTSSVTRSSLTLTEGQMYYTCARSEDNAGNISAAACSNGQTLDITAPAAVVTVNDGTGADATWATSSSQLSANWTASSDALSGLSSYEYCMATATTLTGCSGTLVASWTSTALTRNATAIGLSLVEGTMYYTCVRVTDQAGNVSGATCSNGQTLDSVAPPVPAPVFDGTATDIDWTNNATALSANWATVTDSNSGLLRYQYCMATATDGSGCTGTVLFSWTNRTTTSVTRTSLTLTEGQAYYTCVRAQDNAGNTSSHACSNGVTVDVTAPTASTTVRDGTGTDVQWTGSTSELSANWTSATDSLSGIARYDYCMATATTASGCSGTVLVSWISNATATTITRTGLSLANAQTYFTCVRAVDNAGNISAVTCSDGQTVDTTAPPANAWVNDGTGTDVTWRTSTTSLSANWDSVVDGESGLLRYEYCFSTGTTASGCSGTVVVSWTNRSSTSVTASSLSLVEGTTYYACVRAVDNAGNTSSATCSNGQTVDATAPSLPSPVYDGTDTGVDAQWTRLTDRLSANWTAATDAVSGLRRYRYCLATATDATGCTGTVLLAWTTVTPTSVTRTGLTLTEGQTYFTCVRSEDWAGNQSAAVCSDGQTVDVTAPATITTVNDGTGADQTWTTSLTNLSSNWTVSTDGLSGIDRYEYCIGTTTDATGCTGTPTVSWTSNGTTRSVTVASLSLTDGMTYTSCVRAIDGAGNASLVTCSNGITVDSTAPPVPSPVNDGTGADVQWTTTATALSANWAAVTDATSGLRRYQYCFSTATTASGCSGTVLVSWTNRTSTSVTHTGLALSEGQTYYACARSEDNAGNFSAATCSNGQRVDTVAPSTPSPVNDGTGADLQWAGSTTQLSANWATSTDATSGVGRYEYCMATATTASGCSGTTIVSWTSTLLSTSVTRTGLALVQGTTYFTCVRTFDNAGLASTVACSNGQTVDAAAPASPSPVNDGTGSDVQWTTSSSQLSANWPSVTDTGSGLNRYEYCISTATTASGCSGSTIVSWTSTSTSTSVTRTGLTLTNNQVYYTCVRAIDNAGNTSTATCSNGQTVDTTIPAAPTTVNDGTAADLQWTTSTSQLSANWSAVSDTGSGLSRYEYCISTATIASGCSGTTIVSWESNNTSTSLTRTGLALAEAQVYHTCVRAIDNAGNTSGARCSNGQTVDTVAPSGPSAANDGTGADVQWTSSTSQLSASWLAATDATSGLNRYEYCMSTASGCMGTVVAAWTSAGTSTSITHNGLTLIEGTTYYTCVRAVDNADNTATMTCTDGQTVDSTNPPATAWVNDGTAGDITWRRSTSSLSANWDAVVDGGSGLATYEYCIATAADASGCAGTIAAAWTANATTAVTRSGLTLVDGETYFTCVRAIDATGNTGAVTCSDGQTVDVSTPPVPTPVSDGTGADLEWVSSLSSLSANWTAVTDGISGLRRYRYCISTATDATGCIGTVLVTWTNVTSTSMTRTSLTLTEGTGYFTCVRAEDWAGNLSAAVCSDGQTVDVTAPGTPTPVNDGTGADQQWTSSTSQLAANWASSSDAVSGLGRYEYCFSTTTDATGCAGTPLIGWTSNAAATSVTRTGLTLTDGTTYYACARAVDNAGNASTPTCSNGITVDASAPAAPATVNDSTGADVQWTGSASQLSANWSPITDGTSGLNRYEYCMATATTASGCSGTIVAAWTSTSTSTSVTRSGLTLTNGQAYYTCVRVVDNAGNVSSVRCSNGQTVDTVAPPAATPVNDGAGADAQWTTSITQLAANWGAVTDGGSGLARYDYCMSTATTASGCSGTVVASWTSVGTSTTVTRTSLTLTDGQVYYTCVRAVDNVGNVGASACSNGQTVDATAPAATSAVSDGTGADVQWTSSTTQLAANWLASSDATSGINRYEYCMSTATACLGTVIAGWTSTGGSTSVTRTGLTLLEGQVYFTCVRIIDNAGNTSTATCSDGQAVDTVAPGSPTPVNDGTGADATWTSSTSQLSANWGAATDGGSGLSTYQYCMATATDATGCAGVVVASWTNRSTTSVTRTSLSLAEGSTYYSCVRAVDVAGNVSAVTCSNGITVDATAPGAAAPVNDGTGADAQWTTSTSALSANWATATDAASGLRRYRYCMSTAVDGTGCIGTVLIAWTNTTTTSVTRTSLALVEGTTYFTCARAEDWAGNLSTITCSDGQAVDSVAPAAPGSVNDGPGADRTWQSSTTALDANWAAVTDGGSGLSRYETCFSTAPSCGGTVVSAWATAGPSTSVSRTGLTLTAGVTYYASVRAVDVAGNTSTVANSNGVTVLAVTSTSPSSAPPGATGTVVQVMGAGFASGATVGFSGTGITITSTTYVSSTRIDVTIDVDSGAATGDRHVTVTNPDGTAATRTNGFSVSAASITVGLSTVGYHDVARDGDGASTIGFGTLLPGVARTIGPGDSGQTTTGAAVEVSINSNTSTVIQASSTSWSTGSASLDAGQLAWRPHGTTTAWTSMQSTATTIAGPITSGTSTHGFDLRLAIPSGQAAGSYTGTVTYTVMVAP